MREDLTLANPIVHTVPEHLHATPPSTARRVACREEGLGAVAR